MSKTEFNQFINKETSKAFLKNGFKRELEEWTHRQTIRNADMSLLIDAKLGSSTGQNQLHLNPDIIHMDFYEHHHL